MNVVRLHNEVNMMHNLNNYTLDLIHATRRINPIKLLINAHDIINLNLEVEKRFDDYKDFPPWDISALKDLTRIRRELFVYHRKDFNPILLFDKYNSQTSNLLKIIEINRNAKYFNELKN